MKRLLVLLLCAPFLHAMELAVPAKPYSSLISLGGDCQVAHQMRTHSLRPYALPFDWLICTPESVVDLLKADFKSFLDPRHLAYVQGSSPHILDRLYGVKMIHDFMVQPDFLGWKAETPDDSWREYDSVVAKYQRRIQRYRDTITAAKKILFIRKNVSREQAGVLIAALKKLYPDIDLDLVALDGTDEIKEPWGTKDITNYFLRQPDPYVWKGDNKAWREIFFDKLNLSAMKVENAPEGFKNE